MSPVTKSMRVSSQQQHKKYMDILIEQITQAWWSPMELGMTKSQ